MKKIISIALAAFFAVSMLAGCGGNDSSKTEGSGAANSTSSSSSSNASTASKSSNSSSESSAVDASAASIAADSGVDLNDVLDKINNENGLSLERVSETKRLKRYYNIAEEDVKQFAAENDKSDPNAPIEIVLVEGVDSAAADRIEEALKFRYDSVINTYTSYTPEKVDMVKACKVTKDGNFVSMIIHENAADMVSIFQDSIK